MYSNVDKYKKTNFLLPIICIVQLSEIIWKCFVCSESHTIWLVTIPRLIDQIAGANTRHLIAGTNTRHLIAGTYTHKDTLLKGLPCPLFDCFMQLYQHWPHATWKWFFLNKSKLDSKISSREWAPSIWNEYVIISEQNYSNSSQTIYEKKMNNLTMTFAVRETASLGIMGAPRVPPLNPSESIVLSCIGLQIFRISIIRNNIQFCIWDCSRNYWNNCSSYRRRFLILIIFTIIRLIWIPTACHSKCMLR